MYKEIRQHVEPQTDPMSVYDYVIAVWTGPEADVPTEIVGTAFSIGGGYFLTADHVIRAAMAAPHSGVATARHGETRVTGGGIQEPPALKSFDVAIFKASAIDSLLAFKWAAVKLPLASEVRTFGFPYGLDLEHGEMRVRAFSGTVVGGKTFRRLPGMPSVYELSFWNPRGLSGAPLLISIKEHSDVIVGTILGNESTEMEVLTSREQVRVGGPSGIERQEVYTRVEVLELGIAVKCYEVLSLQPPQLKGKSIREHLREHDLLLDIITPAGEPFLSSDSLL